jgi:hypothetical protein
MSHASAGRLPSEYPKRYRCWRRSLARPLTCRLLRSNIALNAGTYLALRIAVAQEPTPLAVEVSVVRWCKDGHVGVEFLRYRQGDRERVTNLVQALPPTAIPAHADHATLTLSTVGS